MQRSSKILALFLCLWASYANAQGITPVSGGGGSGSGTVTSIATTCGVSGGTITTTGTIKAIATPNAQTGTSYAILDGDCGKALTLSNASPVAVSIAQAGTAGSFASGWFVTVVNEGAGLVTITPTTSTIDGAASLTIKQNQGVDLWTDGTNYFTARGRPTNVAASDLTGLGTGVSTALGVNVGSAGAVVTFNGALGTPSSGTLTNATGLPVSTGVSGLGTGVATAAASNLSANGGLTTTIASGAKALATSAISSAACTSAQTDTATNTATTDTVIATFNGDPTAVTGYVPLTTGMLTIIVYPTANTVNFKVCNNTSASITPGAITLNWRVVR